MLLRIPEEIFGFSKLSACALIEILPSGITGSIACETSSGDVLNDDLL